MKSGMVSGFTVCSALLDELSLDELSLDELLLDELSLDELSLDELLLDELSLDELLLDELLLDEFSLDEESLSEEFFSLELELSLDNVLFTDDIDDKLLFGNELFLEDDAPSLLPVTLHAKTNGVQSINDKINNSSFFIC